MRREGWAALLVVVVLSVGAYLYYFSWDSPLLAEGDIDHFAVGLEGTSVRDFLVFDEPSDEAVRDRLVALINEAVVTDEDVHLAEGDPLIILFRADGLQYHVFRGGGDLVGLSEGDRSYVGGLRSAELAALVDELTAAAGEEPES